MINVDNGWYARGEFPPAGTDCEFWDCGYWHLARIIGMDAEGLCVASVLFDEHSGYRASPLVSDFRPIKTDPELQRDVDIREALEHIKQDWYAKPGATVSEYVVNAITQLYDAGWRKQMSRYEVNSILMSVPHVPIGDNCRHAILDALYYGKE